MVERIVAAVIGNNNPPIPPERVLALGNSTLVDEYLLQHPETVSQAPPACSPPAVLAVTGGRGPAPLRRAAAPLCRCWPRFPSPWTAQPASGSKSSPTAACSGSRGTTRTPTRISRRAGALHPQGARDTGCATAPAARRAAPPALAKRTALPPCGLSVRPVYACRCPYKPRWSGRSCDCWPRSQRWDGMWTSRPSLIRPPMCV